MSKTITRLALLAALSLAVTSQLSAQNNKVEAQTRPPRGLPKIKMNLSKQGAGQMSLSILGLTQRMNTSTRRAGDPDMLFRQAASFTSRQLPKKWRTSIRRCLT